MGYPRFYQEKNEVREDFGGRSGLWIIKKGGRFDRFFLLE